jgi:hypothetical protein
MTTYRQGVIAARFIILMEEDHNEKDQGSVSLRAD